MGKAAVMPPTYITIELEDFEYIIPDIFSDLLIPVPPRSVQKSLVLNDTLYNSQLKDNQLKSLMDSSIENNINILKHGSIGINKETLNISSRKWVRGYWYICKRLL